MNASPLGAFRRGLYNIPSLTLEHFHLPMTDTQTSTAILNALCDGNDLSEAQTTTMMRGILTGEWTPAQIAGALVALKIKGEKPAELAAAAAVMREMATAVPVNGDDIVDTCGTGGDGGKTFNISTAAAFVAAACGVRIAKHGNRAISGSSGSSDVLEQLGMPLNMTPEKVAQLINTVGIGFMFAPNHHAAVKYAMPVRRELGVRTMFNMLGPLTNPAGAKRQVIGVFSPDVLVPYAETLAKLGVTHALIVHGGGLDEISISTETDVAELKDGTIIRSTIAPEDVGLSRAALKAIQIASPAQAKDALLSAIGDKTGAARDVVLLNAAAALIVAGKAADFADGVRQAAAAIDSGAARQKLDDFIQAANG